jgi:S1-C subfamily serine protease
VDAYLEADVAVHPGYSGGPLLDMSGRVVGLNTAHLLRGRSLALPLATLTRVVDQLTQHGRVRRGYLGISAHPVALPNELVSVAGRDGTALLISGVEPDSPAQKAGVLMGDALLALDGKAVGELSELWLELSDEKIGTAVRATLLRAGQTREVQVTVGARP